jgi:hypothetical protein
MHLAEAVREHASAARFPSQHQYLRAIGADCAITAITVFISVLKRL